MTDLCGRDRLALRLPSVGIWSLMASLDVVAMLCSAKPDFLVFDWEHGAWGPGATDTAVVLAQRMGVGAVVRIGGPDPASVQRAHDTGADVVQVAGIRDGNDVLSLCAAAATPPGGLRGFSPWSAGSMLGDHHAGSAMIVPQVESPTALGAILRLGPEELSRFSAVFLGRYDFSVAVGAPGEIGAPDVLAAARGLAAHLDGTGVLFGTVAADAAEAREMRGLGANYITVSSDRAILARGAESILGR